MSLSPERGNCKELLFPQNIDTFLSMHFIPANICMWRLFNNAIFSPLKNLYAVSSFSVQLCFVSLSATVSSRVDNP